MIAFQDFYSLVSFLTTDKMNALDDLKHNITEEKIKSENEKVRLFLGR